MLGRVLQEEDKKRERRARAQEKLQEVSMPRGMEERMATSQRRAEERRRQRRGVDPEWQTKHPKNPLGYMPNFDEVPPPPPPPSLLFCPPPPPLQGCSALYLEQLAMSRLHTNESRAADR